VIAAGEKRTRVDETVGGKYRIVRLIGQGGMGAVYEAQHTVVKRRFAVKFLRSDLAERRDILTRFQREAEAAGALESEHVAAALDFGIATDGTPYIVMEYLVGESLAALLAREGRLPIARAADLVAQAARGIDVAHGAGIVHRDLKPQNLFVCRRQDGTDLLKVLDFGVAKLEALDEMNADTRTGSVLGTAAYMSPEQARGDKVVDHRSDLYALGAILYELCSGQRPHPGDSHNAVLHHVATHPAVPLESVLDDLPEGFGTAVAAALASDREQRPATAEAFVQALAPFGRRDVWPASPSDSGARPAPRITVVADAPAELARPPRAARRRLAPALVTGTGLTLAVIAIVVAVVTRRSGAAPHATGPASEPVAAELPSRAPPLPQPAPGAPPAPPDQPVAQPVAAPETASASVAARPAPHAPRRHPPVRATAGPAPAPADPRSIPIDFDQHNPYE
jgi:tRNA A-37 threonylcarbamoyl transferase component Bud32